MTRSVRTPKSHAYGDWLIMRAKTYNYDITVLTRKKLLLEDYIKFSYIWKFANDNGTLGVSSFFMRSEDERTRLLNYLNDLEFIELMKCVWNERKKKHVINVLELTLEQRNDKNYGINGTIRRSENSW